MGSRPTPPIYLKDYLEYPDDIWGRFGAWLESNFFEVGQLHRPSETPLRSSRGASEGKKRGKNFLKKMLQNYIEIRRCSKKYAHRFQNVFKDLKSLSLQFWGRQKFLWLWAYFWKFKFVGQKISKMTLPSK